jgi:hypothetical protein
MMRKFSRPARRKRKALFTKRVSKRRVPRIIQKQVRDIEHPLKVLAICYGGMRSTLVISALKSAVEQMDYKRKTYSRCFKLESTYQSKLNQPAVNDADILLLMGREGSIGTPKSIIPLIEGQKHKIVYWSGDWYFREESSEDLITRILNRASTFLDLHF